MILKISSKSNPNSVAGMIAAMIKQEDKVELQCVGAGAVNQGVKAIIIAKGFLSPRGIDIRINPSFKEIEIDDVNRTCIRLVVEVQ